MESISVENEYLETTLRQALCLDLPYSHRRSETEIGGKAAAVLVLFGYGGGLELGKTISGNHLNASPGGASEPAILFTRRTEQVETHKGQIAFPGGVSDPEDRDLADTALRETDEEVGISPSLIKIMGEMENLATPTGFLIKPIVGVLKQPVSQVPLTVNPAEIAETFWAPMSLLHHPQTYRLEKITTGPGGNFQFSTHVYQVGNHRIWGATGAILKNLLDRMGALG